MLSALTKYAKRLAAALALKNDTKTAPAIAKQIQARVLNPDVAHGAPLVPKSVVRVVTGSPEDHWITKL